MKKIFITPIIIITALASCQNWARQDFAPAKLQNGEDYCVQIITKNDTYEGAIDIYGKLAPASTDTLHSGSHAIFQADTSRIVFRGKENAEGRAVINCQYHDIIMHKIKRNAVRISCPFGPKYRLQGIVQTDSTLAFTVALGKKIKEKVMVTGNFKGIKTLKELLPASLDGEIAITHTSTDSVDGNTHTIIEMEAGSKLPEIYSRCLDIAYAFVDSCLCTEEGENFTGELLQAVKEGTIPSVCHYINNPYM